jgi:hypothetical protein
MFCIAVQRRLKTTAAPKNEDEIPLGAEVLEMRKGQMSKHAHDSVGSIVRTLIRFSRFKCARARIVVRNLLAIESPTFDLHKGREKSTPDCWHVIHRQTKVQTITAGMISARVVHSHSRLSSPLWASRERRIDLEPIRIRQVFQMVLACWAAFCSPKGCTRAQSR